MFAALYAWSRWWCCWPRSGRACGPPTGWCDPISSLIDAAERVSEGDLTAQVEVERDDDEIGTLGLAFNRMTQQLGAQRSELVAANRQIDERRRFTETVLSGVSAGVIGLDDDGTHHHRQPRRGAAAQCRAGGDGRPPLFRKPCRNWRR